MNSRKASMRKADKPFMKKPMRDVLQPMFDDSGQSVDSVNDTVDVFDFNEGFNEKLIAYNEQISYIDEDYKKLVPFSQILVRVEVNPLRRNDQGLLMPSEQIVSLPTNSKIGSVGALKNPWPFSRIAHIVATPQYMKEELKVGDVVILANPVTEGKMLGSGDNGYINLPFQFLHPDFIEGNNMPLDPSHKGYGYMLIPAQAIQIKK